MKGFVPNSHCAQEGRATKIDRRVCSGRKGVRANDTNKALLQRLISPQHGAQRRRQRQRSACSQQVAGCRPSDLDHRRAGNARRSKFGRCPAPRRLSSHTSIKALLTMSSASDFNVSLEQHLIQALEPLVPLLPDTLSTELSAVLLCTATNASLPTSSSNAAASPPTSSPGTAYTDPLIRYSLLSKISAWTRSAEGRKALTAHDPPLEPNAYSMVALLAGTRTSPEKKFPAASAFPADGETTQKELNDRRAVTAVLNALLSIIGSGVATWWAADRLRWKDEWVCGCFHGGPWGSNASPDHMCPWQGGTN